MLRISQQSLWFESSSDFVLPASDKLYIFFLRLTPHRRAKPFLAFFDINAGLGLDISHLYSWSYFNRHHISCMNEVCRIKRARCFYDSSGPGARRSYAACEQRRYASEVDGHNEHQIL